MRIFLWLILGLSSLSQADWLDKSEGPFFPAQTAEHVQTLKSFPAFWWNTYVLEVALDGDPFVAARQLCSSLKASRVFARVECEQSPADYLDLVKDWARDTLRRQNFPPNFTQRLRSAYAEASLPMPRSVLELYRVDPLKTHLDLIHRLESKMTIDLPRVNGFFWDEATRRFVIPVQFKQSPSEVHLVREALEKLVNGKALTLLGPHGSALENRTQIEQDLYRVSWVGLAVLFLFLGFLSFRGEWRLFWVLPPVLAGTFLAFISTAIVFGSVHGLVLSFGTGIIGLVIDYGLMLSLSPDKDSVWRSNFLGFVTTAICLVILLFSSIPLLRQLMVFSLFGFVYGYLCLYGLYRLFPKLFSAQPLRLSLGASVTQRLTAGLCLVGVIIGVIKLKPTLDLRSFDYQSKQNRALSEWLYPHVIKYPPLFMVSSNGIAFEESVKAREFGRERNIRVETVTNYLPPSVEQSAHLQNWKRHMGSPPIFSVPKELLQFFSPFFNSQEVSKNLTPAYLHHLYANGKWLSLWSPENGEESKQIKEAFPQAVSLYEVVSTFPRTLSKELSWMGPLSALAVFLLLLSGFRNISKSLLCFIPFLSGIGLVAWGAWVTGIGISFVSLIGGVMLLGLSVDYAVFAADSKAEASTATGLIYAAFTTIAGFFPLLFCKHPVLIHLGFTLTVGTLGTLMGAFWGMPWVLQKLRKLP